MQTTTQRVGIVAIFIAFMQLASCAHNLEEEYRFSAILDDGYTLHWNFDLEQQTIGFAVNVSTTGWVGFGLSPNGQMPQSDVVIGWVDNDGNTQFHDRFAIDRYLPPIDESQDWFLVSGEEENGYTILEFTRKLITCDDKDLTIKPDTSRVIWAYHSLDPSSDNGLESLRHEEMGSFSLNLLGGNNEDRIEPNSDSFILKNNELEIPSNDTTYWCSVQYLPENIREQEKYIYKITPVLSEASKKYVHHMVVYLCSTLNHTHVGTGVECTDFSELTVISLCRTEVVVTAWAVGGQEFVFPKDVAYPIGGRGNRAIVILETHFDNPKETVGVLDSSGLKFTYTSNPPIHRASVLSVGFSSNYFLVVPPNRDNFDINAICADVCTNKFFPPDGITVFGNMLHTHLTGHGLVVRHFRKSECGLLEELEPIDENRRYDFNYQQVTLLPKPVKVLPGDSIQLQCFYRTTGIGNVTLGGESTRNEMCVSFLMYYPEIDLGACSSQSTFNSFMSFAQQHIDPLQHTRFFTSLQVQDSDAVQVILDQVDWNDETSAKLENLIGSTALTLCINSTDPTNLISNGVFVDVMMPTADCPYEAPDDCGSEESQTCCAESGAPPQAGICWLLICAISVAALALL